jgi:hypothetical protein
MAIKPYAASRAPKFFAAGTKAECNRCHAASLLPKECLAHIDSDNEHRTIYRLDTMCTLSNCGHMDAHWVIVRK